MTPSPISRSSQVGARAGRGFLRPHCGSSTSSKHWFQASLSPYSLTVKVQHLSGARWLTSDGERGGRSKPQKNRACLTLLNSPTSPCRGHWSVIPSCRSHAGLKREEPALASRTSWGTEIWRDKRERKKKKERQTHTETERETERQGQRQRHKETERDRDKDTERR